jgi:formylmethanofuran dehydrogenase subunit E
MMHSIPQLEELLAHSAGLHRHLCPRQVLGVRMGILAGRLLGIELPQQDKRLLAIVETDGCAADGVSVASGCRVGRRTLRIEDYGKVAATFVDTRTGRAVRIVPRAGVRGLAPAYVPEARNRWEAQLLGYQRMPDDLLLTWQEVMLALPVQAIVSRPGLRTACQICGEEIINGREIVHEGSVLCRACVGGAYYSTHSDHPAVRATPGLPVIS